MTTTIESARVIEARALSKRYGDKVAVDALSFTVAPGKVTGFLGPNGAGKSTTMRLLLGLDRPDRGTATIGGGPYRDLPPPLCTVGALLEAKAVHKGRSAYNHLLCLAQTQHLPRRRVDEVIDLVGLRGVRHKRASGFSLGMAQRLGIAAALLGDPAVLLLDEPVNGLDPEGIVWIRTLMKHLAGEGRTVLSPTARPRSSSRAAPSSRYASARPTRARWPACSRRTAPRSSRPASACSSSRACPLRALPNWPRSKASCSTS